MPVKIAGQVLSVAILGMGRSDMSLLSTAARLLPLIAMAAAKLSQPAAEPIPEPTLPAAQQPAAAADEAKPEAEAEAEVGAGHPDATQLDSHALDHLYSAGVAGDLYNTGNSIMGQQPAEGDEPGEQAEAETEAEASTELGSKLPRESSGVVRLTANAGLLEGECLQCCSVGRKGRSGTVAEIVLWHDLIAAIGQ